MDPLQEAFEKDLLGKLELKATSNISRETLLLKIFKFIDLNGSGEIRKPEFLKAAAKAGVLLDDPEVSDHLFRLYSNNQQTLNYRDFIQQVTTERRPTYEQPLFPYQGQAPQQTAQASQDQVKNALELFRTKLAVRGPLGLLTFAKVLRAAQQTNCLTSQQFFQVARDQRVDVDMNSLVIIFQQADRNSSGNATFDDLIAVIKGQLPIYRSTLIKQVFESFGALEVPFGFLISRYHADRHPDTRHHNRRPEELREEFAASLEIYQYLTKKSYFDINSFVDFYHYFGFNLSNDELFRSITVSVWDLDTQGSPQRNVANKAHIESQAPYQVPAQNKTPTRYAPQPLQHEDQFDVRSQASKAQSQAQQQEVRSQASRAAQPQQQELSPRSRASQRSQTSTNQLRQVELIVQRIKNRLATRGAKGFISMYRAFKMLDTDKDGLLTITEFRKAVRDHRIDVTDQEVDLVFAYFDRDSTGLIDLWGMLFVLKGEMNAQRALIVEQAFAKVDKDNHGAVTLQDIRAAFQPRNHPEVRSGKRQDEDVQQDFFDSLLMLHHINGGFGSEIISKDEFFEFFSNYSASIPDDKYFEQILQQTFRLGTETALHTNYAGGGKRTFEPDHKKGYLQDHHRYVVSGGSVAANAPFGTFAEPSEPSVKSRPQTGYQQSSSFNIFKPLEDNPPKQRVVQPAQQVEVSNGTKGDPIVGIKQRVAARGIRGLISIQKKLRQFDRSQLGTVAYPEFRKVFNDLRIQVAEGVLQETFKYYEVEETGVMNYDGFVKALQGTMSQKKFNIVMNAYDSLLKQGQSVNFDDVRDAYNPRTHPDVKNNRRREEDVLAEFLDTFEENHRLYTGVEYYQDPNVSFEEFVNYYNNFSALIDDDSQFEQVILGVWPSKRRF